MIAERYRRDYAGEFVVRTTTLRDGIKHQERLWIDTPIENHHTSGFAAVIGTRCDQDRFDHRRLQHHRGGLRASRKLFTYGTGDVWRDMRLDYYVTTDAQQLKDLQQHITHKITPVMTQALRYHEVTKVYTTTNRYIDHEGKFVLVPHSPMMSDLALPVYLAAFDGVREIYMLGYNQEITANDRTWRRDIHQIMLTYPSTKFVLVGTPSNMPCEWLELLNVSALTHRQFVTKCDV